MKKEEVGEVYEWESEGRNGGLLILGNGMGMGVGA